MRTRERWLTLAMIGFWAAGLPAAARAQTRGRAQPPEDPRPNQAKAACAAGEVQKGIQLLADLYVQTNNLTFVYNQGRCYQQNGQPAQAIERFREYLRRESKITAAERAEVETFITELERQLEARATVAPAAVAPAPAPVAAAPAAPPPPPPRLAPPAPDVASTLTAAPTPTRSRPLVITAAALAAVGVAGLATGVTGSLKIRSLQNEIDTHPRDQRLTTAQWQSKLDGAARWETLQWVGYATGAAALAGAAATYYFSTPRSTTVTVSPTGDGALASAQLRF